MWDLWRIRGPLKLKIRGKKKLEVKIDLVVKPLAIIYNKGRMHLRNGLVL